MLPSERPSPASTDPHRATAGRRRRSLAAAAAGAALGAALVLAGCSSGSGQVATAPTSSVPPATSPAPSGSLDPGPGPTAITTTVSLRPVVEGLEAPTAVAPRPGDRELWVTEQGGTVRRVTRASATDPATGLPGPIRFELDPQPVLSLGELTRGGGERGLLGIAFATDGRHVYLHHTDPQGDIIVAEYAIVEGDDGAATVDPGTRRVLLTIPHREHANHNGGQLAVGPDGFLYIGVGDGGGAGDPGDNGQDTNELLGKILRIDPEGRTAERAYTVPPGNPFIAGGGAPEIYLYGARNPWRFSFDSATRDLWVADVGQNKIEEINWLPAVTGAGAGANLGWNWREGNQPFRQGTPPGGLTDPVFTYPHTGEACSVTGGYVYRGEQFPELDGVYVYGDYCVGEIRGLLARNGAVLDDRSLGAAVPANSLVSFGQGTDGELYALSADGALLAIEAG